MKTYTNFKNAFLLATLLLTGLFTSSTYAQKIEKYSGPMVLPKEIPTVILDNEDDFEPGESKGSIEYSYYTNSEGERVWHGKFNFQGKAYTGGIFNTNVVGEYKDGKKVGTWFYGIGGGVSLNGAGQLIKTPNSREKFALFSYSDDERNGDFGALLKPRTNDYFTMSLEGVLKDNLPAGEITINFLCLVKWQEHLLQVLMMMVSLAEHGH